MESSNLQQNLEERYWPYSPKLLSKKTTQTRGTTDLFTMEAAAQAEAAVKLLESAKAAREEAETKAAKEVEKTKTGKVRTWAFARWSAGKYTHVRGDHELPEKKRRLDPSRYTYSSSQDSIENFSATQDQKDIAKIFREKVPKLMSMMRRIPIDRINRMLNYPPHSALPQGDEKTDRSTRMTEASHAITPAASTSSSSTCIERGLYISYTISQDASTELSGRFQGAMKSVLGRKRKFRLES